MWKNGMWCLGSLVLLALLALAGCQQSKAKTPPPAARKAKKSPPRPWEKKGATPPGLKKKPIRQQAKKGLILNITSSGKADPHAVTMALQLAGHGLKDGRKVVLFFNVKGVDVPTKTFSKKLAFKDKPIKMLLGKLIKDGATVLVCPHCMKAMGLSKKDLVAGAQVANRAKLFGPLDHSAVFTY